jgi:hypothetical protein
MLIRLSMILLSALLAGCTNPALILIDGSIHAYSLGDRFEFSVASETIYDTHAIQNVDEQGRFEARLNMRSVGDLESIVLKKNGTQINKYVVEKVLESNGTESWVLKDIGNQLVFRIDGSGPYRLHNLILMGEFAARDPVEAP